MTVAASSPAFVPSDETARIRGRIDHPIIDADGHFLQFMPYVFEIVGEIAGTDTARRYERAWRERAVPSGYGKTPRLLFWAVPTRNTLDRATAILPDLLYKRLDEIGIDFALLYPTFGVSDPDPEVRHVMARAINTYSARVFDGYRDRLEPVAILPVTTPEEAIASLDHAVVELGLKTAMLGLVPRPPRSDDERARPWIDSLGHESLYDYDPLWARCRELGVAPAFHGSSVGLGFRMSTRNYVHNHLGTFAAAQEAACRSLIIGGVTKRFPELRFSFLEGGVAWAAQLLTDLLGHYEKRNARAIANYDPANLDVDAFRRLFDEFAPRSFLSHRDEIEDELFESVLSSAHEDPSTVDDFAESGLSGIQDIVDVFTRQCFFGCEADDSMNALAFRSEMIPHAARLNAMFASDIGHWDVPDARDVLPEAWELVEHGHLDERDFRNFTFTNAARYLSDANPRFFENTAVAGAVTELRLQ